MDTSSDVSFILSSEGEVGHGRWFGSEMSRAQCMNGWMSFLVSVVNRCPCLFPSRCYAPNAKRCESQGQASDAKRTPMQMRREMMNDGGQSVVCTASKVEGNI